MSAQVGGGREQAGPGKTGSEQAGPGKTGSEQAGPAESSHVESGQDAVEVPVIRVERGNPTPEQLAALTVVLTAAGSGGATPASPGRRTLWAARSRFARPRPAVGPGGWRASALPR